VTSIERAKQFLAGKAKTTALIILPLAAAAVQAHAGTITFSYSPGAGSFISSGLGSTITSFINGVPFPTGISLNGSGSFLMTVGGVGGGGSTCADLCAGPAAFDSGAGVFPVDSIPVTYDFSVQDSNNDPLAWEVRVCMFTSGGGSACNSGAGVTPTKQTVTGGFNISGLLGKTLQFWSADLDVNFAANSTFSANDTVDINVPADTSIDIGPLGLPAPEPGTGWLMAGAAALLAGFRKRLRRR
jgi:hypothetical protein